MRTISNPIEIPILEDCQNQNDSLSSIAEKIAEFELIFFKLECLEHLLAYLQSKTAGVILIDLNLDRANQINLATQIRKIDPKITIIFSIANPKDLSCLTQKHPITDGEVVGIEQYILKSNLSPVFLDVYLKQVLRQVEMAQKLENLEQKNQKLKAELTDAQALFQTVVDSSSSLIWKIDSAERYTFLNQSWLSYIGKTLAEGLQENWRDRIHPEDLEKCDCAYDSALKKCQSFEVEYRCRRFDNTYRTILNTGTRLHNPKGEFAGFLCYCLDISKRKKIEEQLIKQAHRDRVLTEIIQDIHGSLELNSILNTTVAKTNQYLSAERISIVKIIREKLVLLSQSEIENLDCQCDLKIDATRQNKVFEANRQRLSAGKIVTSNHVSLSEIINLDSLELSSESDDFFLIPIIVRKKLWGLIYIEQKQNPRTWQIEEIKFLERVAVQLGVAIEKLELYQELEELAVIDSLTKIANRRKFDCYLEAEWKRLTREKKPLSLILCDVDYFKLYNDTYGHQVGDRCLQKVAKAIGKTVKRSADLVARYGGEEFAVILPNTHLDGAKYIAQQIRLQIASLKIPHINSPLDLYVTLSIGVSSAIPHKNLGFYTLVAAADKGLYQAKELGRNRVVQIESQNL